MLETLAVIPGTIPTADGTALLDAVAILAMFAIVTVLGVVIAGLADDRRAAAIRERLAGLPLKHAA